MIYVGDTKIKNLVINHLIWLLINGSPKKLVVIGISQILIYEKSDISQNSESIKNNSFRVIFSPKICKNCKKHCYKRSFKNHGKRKVNKTVHP
jgi:hypothetical protein